MCICTFQDTIVITSINSFQLQHKLKDLKRAAGNRHCSTQFFKRQEQSNLP
jgi:hypothetical protein